MNYTITEISFPVFVIALVIGFSFYCLGRSHEFTYWANRAVAFKAGEFYIDKNNKRQFRWKVKKK